MASIQPVADIVFIKSAEVLSVRERMHSPKRFVYEVQVEWSNSDSTTCYRGYTDFFDFQCELISSFPSEAGTMKGVERTLPYLPGRKIFQRRTATLAEKRLPQIDDYVKKLIDMPDHISHSDQVLKFFRSNWQEDRLRRGSFSLPHRSSSSSNNSGLLFYKEGGVEYSVRKLSESEVFRDSHSPSPDQDSRYYHNSQIVLRALLLVLLVQLGHKSHCKKNIGPHDIYPIDIYSLVVCTHLSTYKGNSINDYST